MTQYDNNSIAGILEVMADLLEIEGVDKFRFLSYRKAAHAIRAWPEDLAVMAAEDRLTAIPGVGAKLARSITDIFETGTFPEFEDAKSQLPESVGELTGVSGVGPKKAKMLHDELGVISVDELEAAIAAGRLEGLRGFGAKTIDNISLGIEAYKRHHARVLLSEALPLANEFVSYLLTVEGVRAAEPAGSVRRMKDTIGDIDVIVSSSSPSAVMEAARVMPLVTRVIGSGATKTSVMTIRGLQVDVRVVDPSQYGAALQYFTGNKDHNIILRDYAKQRGLKVNEYGVFRLGDDGTEVERLGGASEEEVYRLLGMDVPPPEIREGLGEVEAALAHRLPHLVELDDVRGDLHAHTTSTDAKSTPEENRAMAALLGYSYIAVTDHAYRLRMVLGMTVEGLQQQWEEIDRLNAEGAGPHILKGIELNIGDDGSVDYDDDILAKFDFCIASLHSGWDDPRDVATRRLVRAMGNPFVDIIGHPTGRILGRRDPIDLDMEAVLATAGETGTAMELNSYPDRLDLNDAHLRMARRYGVRFAFGTDAHHSEQLAYMRYGVATARRGWVTPDEVLNCKPLAELLRSFKRAKVLGSA